LRDLEERAQKAISEIVLPHVWQALKDGKRDVEVALVSHGLCISELVAALVRKDTEVERKGGEALGGEYTGLLNTAWTRITIDVPAAKEGIPFQFAEDNLSALVVRVTDMNRHEHLEPVKRQGGGIGSSAFDPAQSDIRAFFGGARLTKEDGRSESNFRDEVGVEHERS